jgi:hypothetical protein
MGRTRKPKPRKPQTLTKPPLGKNPTKYGFRLRGVVPYLVFSLRLFVPITLLVGGWIYWPSNARPFVPGIGINVDCSTPPKVSLSAMILDLTTYRVNLSFENSDKCKTIRLTIPPRTRDLTLVRDWQAFPKPEDFNKAVRESRITLPILGSTPNVLGQGIVFLDMDAIGRGHFAVEMLVDGLIADSFEKFRLLIPQSVAIDGDTPGMQTVRMTIGTIEVTSEFDILDANPLNDRRRQIGPEIIYFNEAKFSELNVLLLSRSRDLWKNIYNIFALAITTSVIAAAVSSLIQHPPKSAR